jgi:hypothetical protein
MKEKKRDTGPEPERVKLEGDWRKSVGKALKKTRPTDGWPETKTKKGGK